MGAAARKCGLARGCARASARVPALTSHSMIPSTATQLLLCLSPGWDAASGRLQRFERAAGEAWQPVADEIPVALGRSGMAWGHGLHPPTGGAEKCEGDGRAPAGVFAITALFGYADAGALPAVLRLPYHRALPGLKCVDDPASAHYNCIVDQSALPGDWTSCEDMLRQDGRYALGAVVAHNSTPPEPGAGSCIFLHVWESPGTPTAGCTAMALAHMRDIALWLDGARAPLLVQLPAAEFARRQAEWGLPRR